MTDRLTTKTDPVLTKRIRITIYLFVGALIAATALGVVVAFFHP